MNKILRIFLLALAFAGCFKFSLDGSFENLFIIFVLIIYSAMFGLLYYFERVRKKPIPKWGAALVLSVMLAFTQFIYLYDSPNRFLQSLSIVYLQLYCVRFWGFHMRLLGRGVSQDDGLDNIFSLSKNETVLFIIAGGVLDMLLLATASAFWSSQSAFLIVAGIAGMELIAYWLLHKWSSLSYFVAFDFVIYISMASLQRMHELTSLELVIPLGVCILVTWYYAVMHDWPSIPSPVSKKSIGILSVLAVLGVLSLIVFNEKIEGYLIIWIVAILALARFAFVVLFNKLPDFHTEVTK